ncbi:imidazole glycerol phosphate synthase subunit HisH [Geminocystis sp. CENA526]|uniref:imidazole glycerol phosphate synthase subunit HisH n=1 Tax=Geminocystis sp. CENA526 TaxID=1355871 RepID=UPI003D6DE718
MSKISVCILDYGSGNVKSVYNLASTLCDQVIISNQNETIKKATHLILPGVGAFGSSMEKILKNIPLDILHQEVFEQEKPFLGICVGMQVLATKGFEFGEYKGLNWIHGEVQKVQVKEKSLPHIGWNNLEIKQKSPLLTDIDDQHDFYFVHSFTFRSEDENNNIAFSHYEDKISAVINYRNIYGVQFHPEKSQISGKLLMRNFLNL